MSVIAPSFDMANILTELSSFLGALSLGCWVVLLIPQLLENYKNQSGESISDLFLIIWLIGDFFNVLGSIYGNVSSTVLVLSFYYIVSDSTLLMQIYYYRWKAARRIASREHEPLLQSRSLEEGLHAPIGKQQIWWDRLSTRQQFGVMGCVVIVSTIVGNLIISSASSDKSDDDLNAWPFTAGCISSVLYFCARIPQIIKNHKAKSTEGLSIIFFVLASVGNTSYAFSILVFPASDYLNYTYANLPWILGAFSTIFLDIYIFYQFIKYRNHY
ncbi:G-protein coupled receptor Stm1 [Schizosaccharomyces pombe]|uniref:Vacuolar arginine/histidine antiporter stm1 n=1 Tax=Schizosaccharomyces pombe (strain 972 / ATCC 24843) TaxID=284812 RepID=STM1_SCHPO|nr:G-protein-coupled receptor Stm1 [Schizosaccharomyces pombe]Q10482.1 RecName: Full=Seven transmembrane protein 1 [Schizosaccharomyces pombe 972h-]AAD45180.1 seven transmembrane protein [Schizosaccharomyces pombe]CAA97356.1 G-protein coupled receptor Stm1 [Schizosaccharomyces pombe]|eukprot:NP_594596.1 G-protein-coupled receptor Stm1 [Schizosaccharomyces pombe]